MRSIAKKFEFSNVVGAFSLIHKVCNVLFSVKTSEQFVDIVLVMGTTGRRKVRFDVGSLFVREFASEKLPNCK